MGYLRRALYGQRPSASADASRRTEFERLAAMDPWARMLLALELGHRGQYLADCRAEADKDAGRLREPDR